MADLEEQTKKIDIALKYTNGDLELAKRMVAGSYTDLFCIKGRIELGKNLFGLFIINIFHRENLIFNVYAVAIADQQVEKLKAYTPIFQYQKEINTLIDAGKSDEITTAIMNKALNSLLRPSTVEEIVSACDKKNLEILTNLIQFGIAGAMKRQKVVAQLDMEEISSFNWEIKSDQDNKMPEINVSEEIIEEKVEKEPEEAAFMESPEIKGFENNYERIIDTSVVLSPVKGLTHDELQNGDKIKILLPYSNSLEREFAKARQVVTPEGKLVPITGTYRKYVSVPDGGFLIYADLPGRILCRTFEESTVKVALAEIPERLAKTGKAVAKDTKKGVSNTVIIGIAVIVVIIIVIALAS